MIPCKNIAIHIPHCDGDEAVCDLADKEITENGTYYPSDDNVQGYGVVTVNIPSANGHSF